MRKLLTFVVMALMAVSASAQLVAEKDWTGATGDLPWIYFDDAQGSAEFVEDGIAITVNKKTGELWQPQAMILEGFDLAKNGNYTVVIVAKFPCDGQLRIYMGDWWDSFQYTFPVEATGDFQEVVCEFPGYGADATGSHVLFQCGDFAGTTIVKKVQVYNENGDDPQLIGEYTIAEKDWTGGFEGDYPLWAQFAEGQKGGVTSDAEGVAITFDTKTGQLWQPQVIILDGFDLIKDGNYIVTIVAKFPCDGQLQINMGDWFGNLQYKFPVKATGDFQEITCEFPEFQFNAQDAHVLFRCGDFKGTTIVKSVKISRLFNDDDPTISGNCGQNVNYVFDKSTHKLTISGTGAMADYSDREKAPWSSYANKIQTIEIGSGVTSIGQDAFDNCTGLTSVTIGNSVTFIGCEAFYGCSGLTSVTIPNSVTSISYHAFSYCSGLTSVTIPNSIKDIGWESFSGCSALTSVTILGSVSFGSAAFDGCNNLSAVHITDLETFLHNSYDVMDDPPHSLSSNPLYYANHLYLNGEEIKDLVIPNTISRINEGALLGCSGLTSVTIPSSVTSIGFYVFDGCSGLKYICLASDKYPSSYTLGNTTCPYIMPQSAFEAGIPQGITNYATYTVSPKYITVKSTTATTATLELTPIDLTGGSAEDATPYEVTMYGLNPGSSVKGSWELETKDRGLASIPKAATKNLVMNVQPAQPTSKIKARLVATVNEPDDDQHFGFEWLRYDAPSIMTPNRVSAPLYEGQIVGSLNNLDPNVYYKYRPYYKSADGSMFYGEWEAFITGDADVFFEPVTHTKEASEVTGESAQLAGSWIEGTEDTEEKGFEYWPESGANTRATGENMIRVIVDGDQTTATVDGLMAGKVYGYHSYVKTASGTTYGEDKTFKTPLPGDANDNGAVDAADIVELVNAKAGHPSASFNLKNADANADGSFTEADITATADIIMKQ